MDQGFQPENDNVLPVMNDDLTKGEDSAPVNAGVRERWIDKQDVLMAMHISARTLQEWRSTGLLPCSKIKRKYYYRESDLYKLLEQHLTYGNGKK
jgi:hypothetical protein